MKKLGGESGQTLVMVALSMAVLLGFAAFATDVGVMLHEKREAQSAADSAAIAAASAVVNGNDPAAAALTAAASNGFSATSNCAAGSTVVCVYKPPTDGHFAGQTGYVETTITQQTPTFFMHLFGRDSMNVSARAVATYVGNASGCLYVLNLKHLKPAANPWGNSTINALNCGFLINGDLTLGASDSVNAGYVGTTGTITNPGDITGSYSENISGFSDPLASLNGVLPTISGTSCTSPPNPPTPDNPNGSPGPACYLNMPLVNGPDGTIPDGVYYYTDPASATYSGKVVGNDVTIILTNGSLLSASGSGGGSGNATLTLTKPEDDSVYSGVVLDAPNYDGELDLDFGSTVATFNGIIYAPYADLSLQDQGGSNKGTCDAGVTVNGKMIIGTLDVNDKNKGNLCINNSSTDGTSPIPRITLVE